MKDFVIGCVIVAGIYFGVQWSDKNNLANKCAEHFINGIIADRKNSNLPPMAITYKTIGIRQFDVAGTNVIDFGLRIATANYPDINEEEPTYIRCQIDPTTFVINDFRFLNKNRK